MGQRYGSSTTSNPSPRPCVIGCCSSATLRRYGLNVTTPDIGYSLPRKRHGIPPVAHAAHDLAVLRPRVVPCGERVMQEHEAHGAARQQIHEPFLEGG